MLLRLGYEMVFEAPAPTPMLVKSSRTAGIPPCARADTGAAGRCEDLGESACAWTTAAPPPGPTVDPRPEQEDGLKGAEQENMDTRVGSNGKMGKISTVERQ